MSDKKEKSLPSIAQLLEESWRLFEKTALMYLKLFGLSVAAVLLAVFIGVLLALPLSFITLGSHSVDLNHLTLFPIIMIILLMVWFILFIVLLISITVITPIVSVFILRGKKGSLFELIKQSKQFFWQYFLTALLSGVVVLGGIMLFFIPGLLFALFFSFVLFEVVLEQQSGSAALKRSYFLVKNNFWEVIARLFILEIGLIIISFVLNRFADGNWLLNLVRILFSLFSMWYARAYMYLLYKQLREHTTLSSHISFRWIWVVSSIGWVLLIFFASMLTFNASHLQGMMRSHSHRIHRIR